MPRSFSICMKSERVRRASPLARTCPAIWIDHRRKRRNFWFQGRLGTRVADARLIANVRRARISGGGAGGLGGGVQHWAADIG